MDKYVNIVAGGNEKLRYTSFSQLVIFQAHPNKPYFRCHSSDENKDELYKLVVSV